jgi:hypothetical protein
MHFDNAAGRLYDILERITKIGNGGKCIEQLMVFFGLAPTPKSLEGHKIFPLVPILTDHLLQLLKLAEEAENELEAIEELNKDLYLTPFPHIKNTIASTMMHLYADWNPFQDEFRKIDFRGLQFCSNELSKVSHEKPIEKAILEEFLAEVNAFSEDVLASEIHWETRHFILDRLNEIRTAISEYRIRGVKGLRECIGKTIGLMYVNPHLATSPEDDSPKAGIIKRFWEYVMKFTKIADQGIKAYEIEERARPHLVPLWNIIKGFLGPGDPPNG